MTNTTSTTANEPFDPREAERLSCMRLGRVPKLKKDTTVWWKYDEQWYAVVVERRAAGDVFWARHKTGRFKGFAVVVSCACYGGLV